MIETKLISFYITCNVKATKPVAVEYPELQKMMDEGWQVSDMLPPWGSGAVYFQSFMMMREGKKQAQRRSK